MRYIYTLAIWLVCSIASYAQNDLRFKRLSIQDGLSQVVALTMFHDSRGFVWIGTQDGLNRYDGYSFKIFRSDPAMRPNTMGSDVVNTIAEDHEGNIWIGGFLGGITKYDVRADKFINYPPLTNNPNDLLINVLSIVPDTANNLWIGSGNGLVRLHFDQQGNPIFETYVNDPNNPRSLSANFVGRIHRDARGNMWVFSGFLERIVYDNVKKVYEFEHHPIDTTQPAGVGWNSPNTNNTVQISLGNSIAEDAQKNLWITTGGGLVKVDVSKSVEKPTFTRFTNFTLPLSGVHFFKNSLWLGLIGTGLAEINPATGEYQLHTSQRFNPYSLSTNVISVIISDHSGMLWVGSNDGINKTDLMNRQFHHYYRQAGNPNSINDDYVFSFCQTKDSILWLGYNAAGFSRFDRKHGTFKHYPLLGAQATIRKIYQDSEGTMWFGSLGGLLRFDPNTETITTYTNNPNDNTSISNNQVFSIFEDSKGRFWIGTGFGLSLMDRKAGTFTQFRNNPNDSTSISSNTQIRSITEDHQGNIWVTTNGGGFNKIVFPTDGRRPYFVRYQNKKNKNSVSHDAIFCIYHDTKKRMWICTYGGGLNRFDPKTEKFTVYTISNGLKSNIVYGILEDRQGNLWFSSNSGLTKFTPETETFKHYDASNGLQSNEFNGGSFYKTKAGEFMFGGVNGFNTFFPDQITNNTIPPKIHFTDVKLFNESIKPSPDGPIRSSALTTDTIELNYYDDMFSVDFAALHYAAPDKNEYAYMVEGHDEKWIPLGRQRSIMFNSFPAGNYTLRIKSANSDGVWDEKGIAVKLIIHPPFWQTTWFYVLVAIISIIAIYSYIKIRERNHIRERERLERIVRERTAEIRQQQEEILAQSEQLSLTNKELRKLSIAASETDNAIAIMDAQGNFEWLNEGFYRMYGYTLDSFVRARGENIMTASSNPEIQALIQTCLSEKTSVIYESLTQNEDGTEHWAQTTLTPVLDDDGNIEKLIAIDSDISKMKAAEAEIMQKNEEIARQRDFANEQTKKITDSILYARRIQEAVLPPNEMLDVLLNEYFVFFRPRDIVSGDFYWIKRIGNRVFMAAADCTGHGVPGAFMSLLGMAFLTEIVTDENQQAADILNELRRRIKLSLRQQGRYNETKDGMDIAFTIFDTHTLQIQFAGAYNPMFYITHKEGTDSADIYVADANNMPIGVFYEEKTFTQTDIQLHKGDMFYLFSDGYIDQFGGPSGRKFLKKNFKKMLFDIHHLPANQQNDALQQNMETWLNPLNKPGKGHDQVDDVLVIGVRV